MKISINPHRARQIVISLALGAALIAPTSAFAATTVQGGPLTSLNPAGDTIHMALSNFPTKAGLYILQCLNTVKAGATKDACDTTNQLWVSTDPNAPTKPTGDVALKVTGTVAGTECGTNKCVIFLTFDHTNAADRTEDQLIPISFAAGTSAPTKPADVITATINGKTLSSSQPGVLGYRTPVKFVASAKSGTAVTALSSTPDCTVVGNVITALKGTGYCDIAMTSAGSLEFQATTAHYPFALKLGIQKITFTRSALRVGKTMTLKAVSNFGETITYDTSSTSNCSLKGLKLKALKKGACNITATAPGSTNLWAATTTKKVVKIS
jgi:hypothetical protein